jgi:hypothetical protein
MSTPRLSEVALLLAVLLVAPIARATPDGPAAVSEDQLSEYRDRFNVGMDRYNSGAISEAIGYWEPIYRKLGPQAGYRLAYNLGVAYGHLGDATRAAERLQAFLDEVDSRRGQGQALGATVAKEEADARERMVDLTQAKGRIRIPTVDPPVTVQVDASEPRTAGFVAWVDPGEHTVTFEPQGAAPETTVVRATAGETVDVQPPTTPAPTAPSSAPAPRIALEPLPERPAPKVVGERRAPFSPVLLATSVGLEVAAGIAAVALESQAIRLHDELTSAAGETGSISPGDRQRFDDERTWAYGAVGAAAGLGAITVGLVSWYFLGSSQHKAVVQPVIGPERGGAMAGAVARF